MMFEYIWDIPLGDLASYKPVIHLNLPPLWSAMGTSTFVR